MDHLVEMIEKMKQLGLTEYEAKTYLALLKESPSNGYTISKNSGVPRSRIYEVIDGLVRKQIVFEIMEGDTKQYSPIEPKFLMDKMKTDFNEALESVETFTTDMFNNNVYSYENKIISGNNDIIDLIKTLMKSAKHRIVLSIWDEDLEPIAEDVALAKEKGIKIRGMYFGLKPVLDELTPHRRIERYEVEVGERYLIVIIDNEHVVSGIISREGNAQVTWSQDPAVIEITDSFIGHDVMINRYSKSLSGQALKIYEDTLDEYRKAYFCFSDAVYETIKFKSENYNVED